MNSTGYNKHNTKINIKIVNKEQYVILCSPGMQIARIETSDIEVVMQNKSINCVTLTKFLGIIMDNKLKWN